MKPIRDIGTLITPSPDSVTQFEPFVQLTLEERRELVRGVFVRAYIMGVDKMYKYENEDQGYPQHDWDVERFLEEQGL